MKSLDGIDAIAWGEHRHAYGSAEDVPDLLRALASPDAAVRAKIFDDGFGLMHQGDVFEATALAIPFMIAMTCDAEIAVDARLMILALLTDMARTRYARPAARMNPFTRAEDARPAAQEEARAQAIRSTHAALIEGKATLAAFRRDARLHDAVVVLIDEIDRCARSVN